MRQSRKQKYHRRDAEALRKIGDTESGRFRCPPQGHGDTQETKEKLTAEFASASSSATRGSGGHG